MTLLVLTAVVATGLLGYAIGTLMAMKAAMKARSVLEKQLSDTTTELKIVQASQAAERAAVLASQRAAELQEKQNQERTALQFESLAQKILDKNSLSLQQVSEKNLAQILTPLKERITEFQKKVEDTYHNESRERFALKSEIEKIVKANEKMTLETQSLTRALKGDVKVQGNWGEMVLERILEASGLRAGEEYITQGEGLKLKDESGRDQRPDVIIRLPEGKHLIVDSKVSLVHYERILSESEALGLGEAKALFLGSIKAHIDGLSKKRYQDLEGLGSPDFVLLFVPIEGAFSMAIQSDASLFSKAWDQGVIVVSPTTLLATLRTIASVWKQERQTRNALEIARVGGALYEKFAGFVDDLKVIDVKLGDAKEAYEKAMNKLSTGKGNLVSRVEHLKKLGAKTSKTLAIESKEASFELSAEASSELSGDLPGESQIEMI